MSVTATTTAYRVKDWERHFENSESRKVKQVRWVAVPNKHDGKGYRRLLKLPGGPGLFGAWVLILQVASRCPKRGTLIDDDGPITAEDLSDKTGAPVELFENALKVLCERKIGWIERFETSGDVPASPETSGDAGAEGNGREGKGKEEDAGGARVPAKPTKRSTAKPTGAHAELIEHFTAGWEERFGNAYAFRGGKDGAAVKNILADCDGDRAKAKGIINAYLADTDAWIVRNGHTLAILASQINRYLAGGNRANHGDNGDYLAPSREPTEEDLAMIRSGGEA